MPEATRLRLRQHQSWINDIPLKFLWTISLSPRDGGRMNRIGNNVASIIKDYEQNSNVVDADILDENTDTTGDVGLLLAQNISYPNELFNIGTEPLQRTGGFIAGYFGDRRADYGGQNKLDITFLETNRDIIDYFIKPWIVAASFKGLIEDGREDIKCNIVINEYSRAGDWYHSKASFSQEGYRPSDGKENSRSDVEWGLRKTYNFYDCVPYNVEPGKLSYGNDLSLGELSVVTSFAFSHYQVKGVERPTF